MTVPYVITAHAGVLKDGLAECRIVLSHRGTRSVIVRGCIGAGDEKPKFSVGYQLQVALQCAKRKSKEVEVGSPCQG